MVGARLGKTLPSHLIIGQVEPTLSGSSSLSRYDAMHAPRRTVSSGGREEAELPAYKLGPSRLANSVGRQTCTVTAPTLLTHSEPNCLNFFSGIELVFFRFQIYDAIKAKHPSVLSKVYPVKGDVILPYLGLSQEDRFSLLGKVNIVFHVAATVRFDEPLHVAVNVNTKGTARVIELWNKLRHPISFVHVSTAYSNANLREIGEKVHTTSLKPAEVIDMCDKLDKTSINEIEKMILKTYPNTYTLSKNLA
ncbi:putative fatty acyl-CoA reductase CG8306 [Bombus pyrosoma]|uniref:putative fatty acyl-CoA reductase CG8306 n=1 Tax=Bombus pyrosoma TaxID=396416 RepID=UPI001CB964D8|nr:putative fatty acyl-CoA reductase CG8306 [Bombus pyrosoma]